MILPGVRPLKLTEGSLSSTFLSSWHQDLEAECRGESDGGHVGLGLHSVPNPLPRHRWLGSDTNRNGERYSRNVRQHKYTTAQTFSPPCRVFPGTWDFSLLKNIYFTPHSKGWSMTVSLKYKDIFWDVVACYPGLLSLHTLAPSPDPPWRWCHTAQASEPGTPGHYTGQTRPEEHVIVWYQLCFVKERVEQNTAQSIHWKKWDPTLFRCNIFIFIIRQKVLCCHPHNWP